METVVVFLRTAGGTFAPFIAEGGALRGNELCWKSLIPFQHSDKPASARPLLVKGNQDEIIGYGRLWAVAKDGRLIESPEEAIAALPREIGSAAEALAILLQDGAGEPAL